MDIKNLELTERDFKMLVDGLDALLSKDVAGDMMGLLLEGIVGKGEENNPAFIEMRSKREMEAKKKATAKEVLIEEIKILQGKLLMFKRYLIQIDALKQVEDLINPIK